jgi:hypothetical protein
LNSLIAHQVAQTLNGVTIMRILFPLLAVAGPVVLLWLGYLGVAKRRTIGRAQPESQRGVWITGPAAVVLGVIYLVAAPLIIYVMMPIAAAMVGVW